MILEHIGVTIAIVSVSMIAILLLAKALKTVVSSVKAKKRRRDVEPSPPRKYIMTKEERDVQRALKAVSKTTRENV